MSNKPSKFNSLQPGSPTKPKHLSARASDAWDRLVRGLTESGFALTAAHRAPLTIAATIAADIGDAWITIGKDGVYIRTKFGLVAHPASKRLDALRRDYIKALSLIGLRAAEPAIEKHVGNALAEVLEGDE